ncbi:hypothetical protein PoB_006794900 [Plakobranchus ocellatus]|uniref:Uncharacterized protein n=1 Tax=Plakobranchus ocellatus TaxID=259542 RepID=A0AAV4DBB5_9GAST|nr:hypothetical protein PoB_006794900 [Plakobranchus ocellatus]
MSLKECLTLRHANLRTVLVRRGDHIELTQQTFRGRDKRVLLSGVRVLPVSMSTGGITVIVRKVLRATVRNIQISSSSDPLGEVVKNIRSGMVPANPDLTSTRPIGKCLAK